MFELTHQSLREHLDYNAATGEFKRKIWPGNQVRVGDIAGGINPLGYRQIAIKGVQFYAHRLAWFYVHGEWPSNQIDHINHNRDDNRIANLREADDAEQRKNMSRPANNTSGVTGVSPAFGKWSAQIKHRGRKIHLGLFQEKAHAIIARKAAEKALGFHKNHGVTQ